MNTIAPNVQKTSTFSLFPVPRIPGLPAIDNATQFVSSTDIVRPNELVCGLIHQGTKAVLASGSKIGKTWILLDMALSVATGTDFLRWKTNVGKVLFINFEIQRAFIKSRVETLMQRRGISKADNLNLWNLRGKTANFEALVANIIREIQGKNYSLIILDPIYKAMVGKSENMSSGVGELCHQLERLAERTGAAVVFAHHFTKGDAKKKAAIDRMSGSGVFARDADSIITLTEHKVAGCYTLEMTLRNLAPQHPFVVQWDYPVMVERDDLDPEEMQSERDENLNGFGQVLYDIVKVTPMTNIEWLAQCIDSGVSRATFYRVKALLRENGHVSYDATRKLWSSTEGGETSETVETGETETAPAPGKIEIERVETAA